MPVSARVLDIVVDRVIVSRNRLESGGMRIRQCAAWGAEYVADAQVLELSRRHDGKANRIKGAGLIASVGVRVHAFDSLSVCNGFDHLKC